MYLFGSGLRRLGLGFVTLGCLRYLRARRLRQDSRRLDSPAYPELQAHNQGTPEGITLFYSELADLLRLFIERRFAVPAPNPTTREFLGDLQKNTALESSQRELLETISQYAAISSSSLAKPRVWRIATLLWNWC